MTQERDYALERAYEEMLATMNSPGWRLIVEDFQRLATAVGDVRNCDNLDFARGQLDVLDLLFGWREATQKAQEQLLNPPPAPDEE